MKAFTPEISWHNRLPVLSVDISRPLNEKGTVYRVATGGNDCRVYIWLIDITSKPSINNPVISIRAGLRRHQKSVGAVRFSSQHMLASGDDDGYIYLWKHKEIEQQEQQVEQSSFESNAFLNDDGFEDLETWQQHRVLRGHIEDICDLAWSKDGKFLLSGSVDNSAILWDTEKCVKIWCSDLIKGYVQGVTIDPYNQFLVALSSDRTLRIYNFSDRKLLNATRRMNVKKDQFKATFYDDTVKTFCRRLEFSPDGQFLIAPTGRLLEKGEQKATNKLFVFKCPSFNRLNFYYSTKEVALCTRFSPIVYKLRNTETNFWNIPYRIVFAVATSRSVLIYDSQQQTPIGYLTGIHLARLTDLAWSSDGRFLMITSYDGYSTLVTFDKNEIGEIYTGELYSPIVEKQKKQEELQQKLLEEEERKEQEKLQKQLEKERQQELLQKAKPPQITILKYFTKKT